MAISIEELHIGNQPDVEEELCCPHCHGPHLHHADIAMNNAWTAARITPSGGIQSTPRNGKERVDIVSIGFWCDACWKVSKLVVEQHKGSSMLTWALWPKDVSRPAYMAEHEMPS